MKEEILQIIQKLSENVELAKMFQILLANIRKNERMSFFSFILKDLYVETSALISIYDFKNSGAISRKIFT